MTDPGLRFWLAHVEAEGGLWESAGDSTLVVLPSALGERYRLPEELLVTDDPDIARSDGVAFLGTGHPILLEAAETVLGSGDTGTVLLETPAGAAPSAEALEFDVREQIPVGHGRIDVVGAPSPAIHWVLRVGALVNYVLSTEDHFAERIERWIHVGTRREVPAAIVDHLAHSALAPGAGDEATPSGLLSALAEVDGLIETDALRRRTTLAGQLGSAYEDERGRAQTYYADAIAGIERRLEGAPPERRVLLESRLNATRDERTRRLTEIAEKHRARHELQPYLLHLIGVPALRVPVHVRRGERRYPMELDWLRPVGAFALPRCPSCDRAAPLVAGKAMLGCTVCLTPRAQPTPPRPAPKTPPAAVPTAAPARAVKPAAAKPAVTVKAPRPRNSPSRPSEVVARQADNLAANLWQAVASGEGRRLRHVLAADSPAAALRTVFGIMAFKAAVGIPLREELVGFTAGSKRGSGGRGSTSGTVETARADYDYALEWIEEPAALKVTEVLRFGSFADGRLPMFFWSMSGLNLDGTVAPTPAPAERLDEVTRLIVVTAPSRHGLAVAARSLAAWGRLSDVHDELLTTHQTAALAAAVHRLVALRAGDKGLFREAAALYGTDETDLRRADARLRKLLALGPARSW